MSDELEHDPQTITAHIISDSLGTTARGVVASAVVQIRRGSVAVSTLSHVQSLAQVRAYLDRYVPAGEKTAVFHTVLDRELRASIREELEERGVPSVDLLGPAISIVTALTDEEPMNIPGLVVDRTVPEVRKIDASKLT
ncbi:kinase/pyrophosphorylase [Paratractidigestivibacter sp.]|uniref:kinase/pyrophosphorylase n=1 Tax=Paratractidigestivibacter sp. TaxID=2847316 RepID=UPI002ABD553D|nr:kinase/pyrophosphorylase [Paratractidigestivibacter sp.]